MKYHIITLGCQMNKSDSERIASLLEKKGYKLALNINEANLIVVNMCSVRQSAVNRIYGLAPKFKKLKTKKQKLKTVLTGCILKRDKPKFRKIFDSILYFKDKNSLSIKPKRQNKFSAFIPISNGCNNFCTYCVVPYTRGSLVCRNHKEILKESKDAIKNKCKEIWLLGQNVNDYQSPANSSINFPKLFKMIEDIPGNFQIYFISPHPKDFSEELINVLSKSKKFSKRLNLPVQSGDNKILKKMNRPYTIEQYKNLVKKIRKKIPNIFLSTDIIVGFPEETKKQFQNTVKLFKEIKFDMAYISKYSPRPGTAVFKTKDDIPIKEKKKREKTLSDLLNQVKQINKL